jgi:hypothetical protein
VTTPIGIIRPGDKLIVRVGRDITDEGFDQVSADLANLQLPDVQVIVICADELAIYRPDGTQ